MQKRRYVEGSSTTAQASINTGQSFRSVPGPNAGILDAEFEAFQASQPFGSTYPEPPLFSHTNPATFFPPNSQQSQQVQSDWASDFQHLHLNEIQSPLLPQSESQRHAQPMQDNAGGWHETFSHRLNQSTQAQQQQFFRPPPSLMHPTLHREAMTTGVQQQRAESQIGACDEAAFEQAFDKAGSDMYAQQQGSQLDQDLFRTAEAGQRLMSSDAEVRLDQNRLGSDRILDEVQMEKAHDTGEHDPNELARTAGQLLENVKDEQSQKFQQSNFLSLMRQIRDKQVVVEGDQLVNVSKPFSD